MSGDIVRSEFGQLELPGMPIATIKVVLKVTKNSLPFTDKVLKPGDHVTGKFDGRVIWPDYDMDDGTLTNVIEVLTAELDENG